MREFYFTPAHARPECERNCPGCRTTMDNHLICPCHPELDGMDLEPCYSPRRRIAKDSHPVVIVCVLALWVSCIAFATAGIVCDATGRLCYVVEAI